jgi:pimeloyl-ACP methyl ester carboxylesterase
MAADAPAWYLQALRDSPSEHEVAVDGCPIRYLSWGRAGTPGVVVVHGGAAHARWWDHLGPLLAGSDRHHVVALDLSGHGDSGWRAGYTLDLWADEVMAVAADAGMVAAPVVIGHSMGGFVTIGVAARHGERLAGAIIVDSPVRAPDPESEEGRGGRMFRQPKTYPDLETAARHFHLVPPQPPPEAHVLEHVARHSLRETPAGWTWKFDPQLFHKRERRRPGDYGSELEQVRCRIAVLHGELSSIVDAGITDYMAERLGRTAPFVEIPQAHHHLILDQPLAFVAAVRALLADWEHSAPLAIPGGGAAADPR